MSDEKLRRMVELARSHVEAGSQASADVYYRAIFNATKEFKTGIERLANGEACAWNARKAIYDRALGTAADWYHRALRADPGAVDYRIEFCVKCLIPMGMYKNALIEAQRAVKIEPNNKLCWKLLGDIQHIMCNVKECVKAYDKQIELDPSPDPWLDRSTIALDTADYKTVRELCNKVLKFKDPERHADAYHNLAMADYREGNFDRALTYYDKAIEGGCFDIGLAHWNKSLTLHSMGRYLEGWAEHEKRGEQTTDASMRIIMRRFTKKPIWNGEPPPAVIHLHQEMGYGDLIAMLRYVNELDKMGYGIQLEVNDSMVELCRRSFPKNVRVFPRAVDYPGALGIPDFDYHIPMLSLPAIFKTDVITVPWHGPYLKPDDDLVKKYQDAIKAVIPFISSETKIGLCWSSGIRDEALWLKEYGMRKSVPIEKLAPLMETPFTFISLQVGPERTDWKKARYFCSQIDPSEPFRIIDLLPEEPTWDDTAALVANLDLVITVDTSVAHLAGALGKPVWLMMHTEGSWHWMTKRTDSPWYPSVKIFRQDKPHEWTEVIDDVAKQLRDFYLKVAV
jgi:tetratricopeptide (TPR) repeat protein